MFRHMVFEPCLEGVLFKQEDVSGYSSSSSSCTAQNLSTKPTQQESVMPHASSLGSSTITSTSSVSSSSPSLSRNGGASLREGESAGHGPYSAQTDADATGPASSVRQSDGGLSQQQEQPQQAPENGVRFPQRPRRSMLRKFLASIATFMVSGLWHEMVLYYMVSQGGVQSPKFRSGCCISVCGGRLTQQGIFTSVL